MFGVEYKYTVDCPFCHKRIVHSSYDDMPEFIYENDNVVEHQCEFCGKKFLVKLNKHILSEIDYEHAYPIMEKYYGFCGIPSERLFERLKEEGVFLDNIDDVVVMNYERDKLHVIMR